MTINLSEEMIYKITCVAFGRLQGLNEKEEAWKNSMAVGQSQIAKKHLMLNEIENAKEDAKEVHELFLELLEQIEKGE